MLYQQIMQNKHKSVFVIVGYLLLFLGIGAAIGYLTMRNMVSGMIITGIVGGLYTWIMLSQSTEIVMRMNHAREINHKEQYPMIWNIVEDMSLVAKVPMPRIFIIEDASPNAFATGMSPEKSAVAVTTGLLAMLNREELEGVIAHEFGHIRNYDVRLQTVAVALGAVISMLTQFTPYLFRGSSRRRDDENGSDGLQVIMLVFSLLAMILGPFVATLMQLALSRNREYLADATAVEFTRNPHGLISALRKISAGPAMEQASRESATLYIANPFKKGDEERDSWFSTHPSTANRIKRLEKM